MSSNATPGVKTSAHGKKRKQAATGAIQPETQSAISGISDDVVVCHVLGRIEDPTDLARLRAVSRVMRDAVAATGHPVEETTWEHAIRFGYLSTLKHLYRHGRLRMSKVLPREAAKKGQLEVVKWLRFFSASCPWDADTCTSAAEGGHLERLQRLRANGCPWNKWTCAYAARGGHLEVLQWAHANVCPWASSMTCAYAARGGHLEVLQWAQANGYPWDEDTCIWAARCGQLEVLQWEHANGCSCNERTCSTAALGGHLEVL